MKKVLLVALGVALYAAYVMYSSATVVKSGSVLITGCSSGIGRAAAFHLAEHGFVVLATYRKDSDRISLEQEATERGLKKQIVPLQLDVVKTESIEKAAHETSLLVKEGRIPALWAVVNNAGISGGGTPLEHDSETHLRRVMEVNFFGAMTVMRAFLPALRATAGRIVSVSSIKGSIATPGGSSYCAAKAAMNMATRVLGREVQHLGMRAVVVEPGYIATAIISNVDQSFVAEQTKLANSAQTVYPGWKRYLDKEFHSNKPAMALSRGVSVNVTNNAILQAVAARFPPPIIRAGGNEVFFANWIPRFVPDAFQDFVSSFVFRYGEVGQSKLARFIGGN